MPLWSDGVERSERYEGNPLYKAIREYFDKRNEEEYLKQKWENEYLKMKLRLLRPTLKSLAKGA